MLKQLSIPWKIFYTTTLLLAIGYVGVLVYVHETVADPENLEHWISYNAVVLSNMTRSGNDFTNNTAHHVRYHNHHNHSVGLFTVRVKAEWKDVTANQLSANAPPDINFDLIAGPIDATFTTYLDFTKTLDATHLWQAGAYTNLFAEWDNNPPPPGFVQAEKFTAEFFPNDFPDQPPRPVEDIKSSGDH